MSRPMTDSEKAVIEAAKALAADFRIKDQSVTPKRYTLVWALSNALARLAAGTEPVAGANEPCQHQCPAHPGRREALVAPPTKEAE